jgi:hypothetical protein
MASSLNKDMKSKAARELIYVISCTEINTGKLVFFALDDYSKFLFLLGIYESFNDETYKLTIRNLLNDPNFKLYKNPFTLVIGYGENVCREIEPELNTIGGHALYDVDRAINNAWPTVQEAFKNKMNLRPVSIAARKQEFSSNFMDSHFISNLQFPSSLNRKCHELLNDFKIHFVSGIDHSTFVTLEAVQSIQNLTQSQIAQAISSLSKTPSQNGMFMADQGNGHYLESIFRMTNRNDQIEFLCFQFQQSSKSQGVTACTLLPDGQIELHTPSGLNSSHILMKLIAANNPNISGLTEFTSKYNPNAFGIKADGLPSTIINVAKLLYLTTKK